MEHIPVLLNEAIDALAIKLSGTYVDGTFGRGGHSQKIINSLNKTGQLFVFDKDHQAIETARELYQKNKNEDKTDEKEIELNSSESRTTLKTKIVITPGSYTQIKKVIEENGLLGKVDGILLDLGVSSPQLDEAERGFSFMKSGFLDMRMDKSCGQSATQWIGQVAERELSDVLKTYGEERYAKRIAKAIVHARGQSPINDTKQLAEIIKLAHPNWQKGKHPATKSFQAIRIYINDELGELKQVLAQLLDVLKPGGRVAIISFHSLEDRIVKQFFKKLSKGDDFPPDLPIRDALLNRQIKLIGRAIKASDSELQSNPRARSAVLRIAEKL